MHWGQLSPLLHRGEHDFLTLSRACTTYMLLYTYTLLLELLPHVATFYQVCSGSAVVYSRPLRTLFCCRTLHSACETTVLRQSHTIRGFALLIYIHLGPYWHACGRMPRMSSVQKPNRDLHLPWTSTPTVNITPWALLTACTTVRWPSKHLICNDWATITHVEGAFERVSLKGSLKQRCGSGGVGAARVLLLASPWLMDTAEKVGKRALHEADAVQHEQCMVAVADVPQIGRMV